MSKAVSRILTVTEAEYLFTRFEDVHCTFTHEGGATIQCPGWDPKAETLTDDNKVGPPGACRYKRSHRLCSALEAAAKGMLVIDIRPRTEEDVKRENESERERVLADLQKLAQTRQMLDEQITKAKEKLSKL